MKVVEINVKKEYKKRFEARQKDEDVLDLIFSLGFFPARLYYPAGVSRGGGYLSVLSSEVWKVSSLKEQGSLSLKRLMEFSFGKDLILKNQEDLVEDRGEIIVVESGPAYESKVERILKGLYPEEKVHHLFFDTLKMQGKVYKILLQAGFVSLHRYCIRDTLGDISTSILQEEKTLIFPVFKDILSDILFKDENLHLDWCLN